MDEVRSKAVPQVPWPLLRAELGEMPPYLKGKHPPSTVVGLFVK